MAASSVYRIKITDRALIDFEVYNILPKKKTRGNYEVEREYKIE